MNSKEIRVEIEELRKMRKMINIKISHLLTELSYAVDKEEPHENIIRDEKYKIILEAYDLKNIFQSIKIKNVILGEEHTDHTLSNSFKLDDIVMKKKYAKNTKMVYRQLYVLIQRVYYEKKFTEMHEFLGVNKSAVSPIFEKGLYDIKHPKIIRKIYLKKENKCP